MKCGFYLGLISSKGSFEMKYGCSWGNLDTRPTEVICNHDDNARMLGVVSVNFFGTKKDNIC